MAWEPHTPHSLKRSGHVRSAEKLCHRLELFRHAWLITMNPSDPMPLLTAMSDADLVAATLAGERRAFGQIVERYQRLLCSLAYSGTGQLSQSEDLAQEAFVDAWRQLRTLREPEKLRAWLCGILRFKVSRLRRADRREPARQAESLETAEPIAAADESAVDRTIRKEEEAILWTALERVPESYREPLILYYREGRSVEHVAVALELTEDNVKQRLARGRKMLQERVLAVVEGALARSTPGRLFTLGVLAALPEIATPAKAIGFGAAAAHSATLAQTTGFAALFASLSGIVGPLLTLRTHLDQSRTRLERRAIVKVTCAFFFGAFGFLGVLWSLRQIAFSAGEQLAIVAGIAQALVVAFIVVWPVGLLRVMTHLRRLRSAERWAHPEAFQDSRDQIASSAGEYRSRWKLWGVPFVHIRFSTPDEGQPGVVGWSRAAIARTASCLRGGAMRWHRSASERCASG